MAKRAKSTAAKRRVMPPPELFQDRIKELRRVPASELIRNPKNWRVHGARQVDALRGVLSEVGFAGAILAFENESDELEIIDGHLRAGVSKDDVIPVLVLDVDRKAADKLLAFYDHIGSMAETDEP